MPSLTNFGKLQSSGKDRLGPLRSERQVARVYDFAVFQMKQEFRFWRFTHLRIAFFTIVVDQEIGQIRQESNQVEQTLTVSLVYLRHGNIVPAFRNSGMDALHVEFGTMQAHHSSVLARLKIMSKGFL